MKFRWIILLVRGVAPSADFAWYIDWRRCDILFAWQTIRYTALCAARYIPLCGMLKQTPDRVLDRVFVFIYPCQIRLNAGNCVLPLFFSDSARWRLLRASSLTLSITDMSDLPGECDAHRPVSQQCWKKTRVPSRPQIWESIKIPLYLYRQLFW